MGLGGGSSLTLRGLVVPAASDDGLLCRRDHLLIARAGGGDDCPLRLDHGGAGRLHRLHSGAA